MKLIPGIFAASLLLLAMFNGCSSDVGMMPNVGNAGVIAQGHDSLNVSIAAPANAIKKHPVGIIELNKEDDLMQLIAQAPGNVLIDFHAPWCGPCRSQGRVLHQLQPRAKALGCRIIKINIDTHPEWAQRFRVTKLPTLMLVKENAIVENRIGYANEKEVLSLLSR